MAISNVHDDDRTRLQVGMPFLVAESVVRHTNDTLGQLIRGAENWWDALFIFLGVIESAPIRFRNGVVVDANKNDLGKLVSLAEFSNLPESTKRKLGIKIMGNTVVMHVGGRRLKLDIEVANPVSIEVSTKEHSMINVRGKDVVDVGAYVDDTAIYYALHEKARHVYAFEPFPYLYRTGMRNINANGLGKLITTYNMAVAGSAGKTSLNSGSTSFGRVDPGRAAPGKRIRVISLDSIVNNLRINHGALKVDCEGCEYGIFKHASSRALRSFDAIHVEYHYGYADIVERLEKEGFDVSYTKPVYNFRGFGKRPMLNGHIVAKRKRRNHG
ncbi:MAG: FkbM family methyltransferase [Candidatus Micrarchaeota archaeon]|nr:FkbM family methyltransferase [Candidatus Micrarchaeota archaeon]